LVGGNAILTFGQWATKQSHFFPDSSGFGSFTVTTIQGKNNKKVSFISAYIAVNKGAKIGIDSLYAQQTTLHERTRIKQGKSPDPKFCPRKDAILRLDYLIQSLQQQQHAIVLMLDANQTSQECYINNTIRPFSIEWLRLCRGMDDPFVQLTGKRPNSTTQTPGRDIDYIYTFGINIRSISTLSINIPAISDHLGIICDIDLATHFSSQYSQTLDSVPRMLSSGNKKSVDLYISYVSKNIKDHNILKHARDLFDTLLDPSIPPPHFSTTLNKLDCQFTEILLAGEQQCMKKRKQRQDWSPAAQLTARTYSYWKQKLIMVNKKLFHRKHLDQLRKGTNITQLEHDSLDIPLIVDRLCCSQNEWKSHKKKSASIRRQFLIERAELLADKLRTAEEKALRAILRAEDSR